MYYERHHHSGSVEYITKVWEDGTHIVEAWVTGTKTSVAKCNIFEFGWNSLAEFLKKKRGFKRIDNDNCNSRNKEIAEV